MITTALSALIVFGVLVLVHEWGHFITAKMTGMRVDEFAIGFGPKLFGWKSGETKYALRCIPLGGFNRIAGMTKEEDEDPEYEYGPAKERAYYRRPIWCRMLVIVAGAAMNILTPVLLFWGMYMFNGVEVGSMEPVIGSVVEQMPAAEAGILPGDRILAVDGNRIEQWSDIAKGITNENLDTHSITVQREDEELNFNITPVEQGSRRLLGIIGTTVHKSVGVVDSLTLAVEHTVFILERMIESLVGMFTGHANASDISGPIGVLQMTGKVAEQGIIPLLNFTALLSLNLGIINLLPIPALDGGHFITLCLEALRGKPLGEKANTIVQGAGIAILLAIMVFATINDITR